MRLNSYLCRNDYCCSINQVKWSFRCCLSLRCSIGPQNRVELIDLFPPDFCNRTEIPLTMVLSVTSTCPFACGLETKINCWVIPIRSHQAYIIAPLNYVSLSDTSIVRTPNLQQMFLHMNLITFFSLILAKGITSTHLLKQPTTSISNFLSPVAKGK